MLRKPIPFISPRRSHDSDLEPPPAAPAMVNNPLGRSPEANSASADPDAQSKLRKLALACDFGAWKIREWRRHRRQVTLDDLHEAILRVSGGPIPSPSQFRRFFEHGAELRDMPARLERAFVLITGGAALAEFHREVHGVEAAAPDCPAHEIEAGLERAA